MFVVVLLFGGCTFGFTTSPIKEVETLLGKYQSKDINVTTQIDYLIAKENMTDNQKQEYRAIMLKQYSNLTYDIKDDIIDGDNAIVSVEIEVYDYASILREVDVYVTANPTSFMDENGNISTALYTEYKLEQLSKATNRIKYTLDINLTKLNNNWVIDSLTEVDLQKIHGIFNA